nr:fasciclin-2-like isoform X5 [Procambarus clarkii]
MAYLVDVLSLMALSVAQEPSLELLPANILKAIDEGVYISCTANVEDPGLVTEMMWSGPNGKEIPNIDGTQTRIKTLEGNEGAGKLDLVIQRLREQDTGTYNCTATYAGNQKLSASVAVNAYMNIDFGDSPVHQTPTINTEYKVRCTPVAKPAPQVDWLKDLVPMKNNDNYIIQQDGILIKRVTEADEGVYRCRARVPELGSIEYRDIQVEVYIPPKIDSPPEDTKGVEKDSVTFHCGASGKPVPSYSWVNKNNEPLEKKDDYFVDSEKGILTIMGLQPEHSGVYRCTAKSLAGEDTASANLQVLTKPKVIEYLNITKPVDDEAEMRCIATGDPLPEIVFQKETNAEAFQTGINQDDRIEVEQATDEENRRVGILKIRGVRRSDDGLYTCTAKSEGGETQVWGHITVEFKPSFEEQPFKELWSWKQQPVNLTCLASSIPNATIQWYLRNQEIFKNDPNLKVLEYGPLGVLRVHPVSNSYFGDYTCEATNRLGTAKMSLELKEAHAPGPITSAKVEKKTATTITWSIIDPMDDGGLPIQGYIVEYRLQDLTWDNAQSTQWTKGSSYTLDGLKPQETYIFRFAARSEAGNGEWSGEKSEEMPRRAAPEEPLIFNVDKHVTEIPYPNQYMLQWQVPLDNGEKIDFFQIIYYQVHNVTGVWENAGTKMTREVEFPGQTTYTIENLRSNSYYKIELRAHNEIGFSTPAEAVIKTANDPSAVTGSGSGPSVQYSSVAPSTSAPAHGPNPEESTESELGIGIIIAIVVIAVLVIALVVDVACFCTNNAGLTAAILSKRGAKDKDKEAMLEDGKNASADTLNEESKDETKTIDEKPVPEKELQKPLEKSVDTKSEKETDDKHEGNGEMKSQKDDGTKPEKEDSEEKIKDTTEPTETTPMIQGLVVNDKNQGVVIGPKNVERQQEQRVTKEEIQLLDSWNSNNQTCQPQIVKSIMRRRATDDELNGRAQSMACENTFGLKKSSKSTPILDSAMSEESLYAVPLLSEDMHGEQTNLKHTFRDGKNKVPPPPPPRRNVYSSLTNVQRSKSQEMLFDNYNQIPQMMYYEERQVNRKPESQYMSASRERVYGEAVNEGSEGSYNMLRNKEPLYQEAESPYYITVGDEWSRGSERNMSGSRGTGNLQAENIINNPYYMRTSKEEVNRLPTNLYDMSSSLQGLNEQMKLGSRVQNESGKNPCIFASKACRSPSESSSSTLYQPLNTLENKTKTQVAYEIAPYDAALNMNSRRKHPEKMSFGEDNTVQVPPCIEIPSIPPEVVISSRYPSKRPGVPPPNIPVKPYSIPSVPLLKGKELSSALQDVNEQKIGLKTATHGYSHEISKPLSHSMDKLDGEYNTSGSVPNYVFNATSLSSAKSLGSLLESTRGQRSYGQPTFL